MSRELDRLRKSTQSHIDAISDSVKCSEKVSDNLIQVKNEYSRVNDISLRAPAIIDNIDKEFKAKTKLTETDIVFLFVATALQCFRQYAIKSNSFRISASDGDALMKDLTALLPPTWQEVLTQSVPYDALNKGHFSTVQNLGLGGTTHRYRTLGHDPVLGWIFGTANIMTRSLTKHNFESFQVTDMIITRRYPLDTPGVFKNAVAYAKKDKLLLPAAVARQAIHFGSDFFTKQGLPVPLLMSVNNDAAKALIVKGNIDMYSILRGAGLAALINYLVSTIHTMFYNDAVDGTPTMYEVRTRKILSYSNALSVGSNVVVSAVTRNPKILDVGGLIVALHRFISDYSFIQNVKRDFLKNEIHKMIIGNTYDFMED